jgi:hypothetical protein
MRTASNLELAWIALMTLVLIGQVYGWVEAVGDRRFMVERGIKIPTVRLTANRNVGSVIRRTIGTMLLLAAGAVLAFLPPPIREVNQQGSAIIIGLFMAFGVERLIETIMERVYSRRIFEASGHPRPGLLGRRREGNHD